MIRANTICTIVRIICWIARMILHKKLQYYRVNCTVKVWSNVVANWCLNRDWFVELCMYLLVFQKQHLLFSPGVGAIPYTPESPAQLLYSPLLLNESGYGDEQVKRGRPAANAIQALISQGSVAESSIRCQYCSRVFPREKSLQAHMRTHTGFYCSLYTSCFHC